MCAASAVARRSRCRGTRRRAEQADRRGEGVRRRRGKSIGSAIAAGAQNVLDAARRHPASAGRDREAKEALKNAADTIRRTLAKSSRTWSARRRA